MSIIYTDDQGALNVNFKGKVIVGSGADGSSPLLVIDTVTGITDIGGEGSDNFIRIMPSEGPTPARMLFSSGGAFQFVGSAMTLPCGAEPSDDALQGSDISFFADEQSGRIRFKFRDSNGVVHVDDVGAYEVTE